MAKPEFELPLHPDEVEAVQSSCDDRKMITVRLPETEIEAFKRYTLAKSAAVGVRVSMNDAHRIAIRAVCGLTKRKK